jgi:hypothetical protein
MKSFILYAALAAISVEAQKSGGKDPYAYKAGDQLKEVPDPLKLMPNKNIPWPSNFGGAKMPRGKIPTGCAPLEVIVGKRICTSQLMQRANQYTNSSGYK